jgi:mannose-P-dolichol utilization defect 1
MEKLSSTVAVFFMAFFWVIHLQRKHVGHILGTTLHRSYTQSSRSSIVLPPPPPYYRRYGENLSLLVQNIILVLLAWQYSSTPVGVQEKVLVVLGYGAYVIAVMKLLPEDMLYLLMSSTWPVMLYARGSQVFATFQVKHTGQLSIVTTSMNLVGALIRIGTTMKETGDTVVLAGYLLSCALSLLMFVQYFMYLKNTKKETASSSDKKQD